VKQLFDSSETVTAEIERISSSGNVIVEIDGREINIGPVTGDAVGTTVEVRLVHSNLGECLDENVRSTNYDIEWVLKKLVEGTPPPGTEFKINVDHINNSGNGMADLGDRTINLGSIRKGAVGKTVPVKMLDNTFAKCLDLSARTSPYEFPSPMSEKYVPEPGEVFSDIIDSISDAGDGIIIAGRRHVNLGPIKPDSLGERVRVEMIDNQFAKCLTEENRGDGYQEWLDERGVTTEENQGEVNAQEIDSENQNIQPTSQSTSSDNEPQRSDTDNNGMGVAPTPEIEVTNELRQLRREAEEDATENPAQATVQTAESQYDRSDKIREYALRRADGVCERCGEDAPFVKPNGDPYLAVHHVDELGKGGADHPSLVVALCPTCHKEIHHGQYGPQVNEALREKLEAGLGDVGASE